MRALDRKFLRDLWAIKGQVVAICMVIAAGVATFVLSLSTLESLRWSKDTYYERYRFAHVFTHVKRAPNSLALRIASIPGVARVQTRITVDVTLDVERDATLDVPRMVEPAVGRLISIPERRAPQLNDLHLRRGRYIAAGRANEVLVSESFAVEHGLEPGAEVVAIINGRRQRLEIVGIALSPEYIIQIPPGSLMPDNRRFGVFWMGYDGLAAALDMEGAFNDVSLTLMHGASEPEVIRQLDQLTATYGSIGAYGRADHVSHTYISDEIRQLRSMGVIGPAIFLSVAAFLLNIVLSRLINTQREQIAALKAFGYTRREVRRHYIKMILAIPMIGVVLGTGTGAWMGRGLTQLYTRFYRFPVAEYHLDESVVVLALAISFSAAIIGTMAAVQRAVKLPPAEAMRPEPPATYRRTLVERLGLGGILPQATRMILRQMERHPFKSAISCLGIATGVAVLILGSFMKDSLDYIMDFQFRLAQRQDLMIAFVEPTSPHVLHDVKHLPGVIRCEPFRSVPSRLHVGHRSRRVGIMGLPSQNSLFRLIDQDERVVGIPDEGLLLSSKLAELLDARVGDMITVKILEGERAERSIPVAALITEFSGTNAYMNLRALTRMLREGPNLGGAFLTFDPRHEESLYRALKETPQIAGITIKAAALQSFEDTLAENLLRMTTFNIIFASIIACGVVYNSARISLSERSRELATLRVIGFTRQEISAILLGELAILTLLALPLGMVMGYGFAAFAALGLDTELNRIPLVVKTATFGFAGVVIVIATMVSGLLVRRQLDHLDLVQVLKSKE